MSSRFKIFSDPVHGFVSVPKTLLLELIQTPEVQRLRRIRQLGVGYLVFPGAEHTRFGHALGAMALMQDALQSLCDKGTPVSAEEQEAALAAALLHDIGHAPFSHTLEHELIRDFHHEAMSRAMIAELNRRFSGGLTRALEIFDGHYPRPFFHQLVSSQLDMDRLDYLRRDSFYTGVSEGVVGVQRIIKTLRVHPIEGGPGSEVVIESKGVYAIENFLISRRLMYWQVYLHKTVLAGDQLLRAVFRRVRDLIAAGRAEVVRQASPALLFFLERPPHVSELDSPAVRRHFCDLDDSDVLYSIKRWSHSGEPVLADLSRRFLHRDFFRVAFLDRDALPDRLEAWRGQVRDWLAARGLADADADPSRYYFHSDLSRHDAYTQEENSIRILERDGRIRELSETPDAGSVSSLSGAVVKPYVCFPKEVGLDLDPA